MKKRIILFFLVFLTGLNAAQNGGYGGAYLRMGLGARAISLGNTGVAAAPSSYTTFYNPAIYGFATDKTVGLSHSFLSLDRRVNFIGISLAIPPEAGFSLGWIESGVNELMSYNSIGQQTGDINHSANAVYFSFGKKFSEKFAVGITMKLLFEYINDGTDDFDYSSQGFGVDFGLLYKITKRITIGYQLKDIKSKLEANTEKLFERGGTTIDYFPLINKIGLQYLTPFDWLTAYYDFEWSSKKAYEHHFGLEALKNKNLALRFGMDNWNPAFGAGIDFKFLKTVSLLDYVFLPALYNEGSSHVFSWQVSW